MPTLNPYSWTNLGHMLWVEQPVGTGFSQGVPNIQVRTMSLPRFNMLMRSYSERDRTRRTIGRVPGTIF